MHFFSKKLEILSKTIQLLLVWKEKTSPIGRIGEEKQYKDYEKDVSLFDGHPSIERGKFFKLLFGILYGAALEPESLWQFDV